MSLLAGTAALAAEPARLEKRGVFLHAVEGKSNVEFRLPAEPGKTYAKVSIAFSMRTAKFQPVFNSLVGLLRPKQTNYFGLMIRADRSRTVIDRMDHTQTGVDAPWKENTDYRMSIVYDAVAGTISVEARHTSGEIMQRIETAIGNRDIRDISDHGGDGLILAFGLDRVYGKAYFPPLGFTFSDLKVELTPGKVEQTPGIVEAEAGDWPRFRGPNGSGVAETSGLPAEIGPAKNVVWKTPLPLGHSSPVISGERIFLTGVEAGKLLTLCLDRVTGKILWRREAPRHRSEKLDQRNTPASPSAAVDGRNVFVFFPDFGVLSYDFDGRERWRTPLGPFNNFYGLGASPVPAGDRVVLVVDQTRDSFAVALGQDDGRIRWKTPRPEALSGHSTPTVYQPEGGPLQVIAPGSFRMDAYSVDTGEIVWWVNGLASEMKSVAVLENGTFYVSGFNTPENDPGRQIRVPPFDEVLAAHDADRNGNLALAESPDERTKRYYPFIDLDSDGQVTPAEWKTYSATMGAENGLLAFRPSGAEVAAEAAAGRRPAQGDMTTRALRWKYQRAVPQLPSVLLYRGVLYMINDGGVLTTLDPETGAVFKQARLRGAADRYFASPVAADGKVFIVSQAGVVSVLKAGGEQELLAVSELDDEVFATPAIARGRLYIRTRSALYSFGL